jgi:hypothetical protein
MEALLNDESLSDVIFVVGDARIHAHRLITQSRYFRAMLTAGFREGQELQTKSARTSGIEAASEITIGNTTPEAFRALLRYPYTDELRFADEQLLDVMRKDKKISPDRVCIQTARRVRQIMSVHNVVALLVKADEYGFEGMQSATLGFLVRNIGRLNADTQVRLLRHVMCIAGIEW